MIFTAVRIPDLYGQKTRASRGCSWVLIWATDIVSAIHFMFTRGHWLP